MRSLVKFAALAGTLGVCVLVGTPPRAFANGDAFFEPQPVAGLQQFLFVGNVKDEDGNNLENVTVRAEGEEPNFVFSVTTNVLGRYRTPDIGTLITNMGYEIDTRKIKISVAKEGYTMRRSLNRGAPRNVKNVAEINFIMAKDDKIQSR